MITLYNYQDAIIKDVRDKMRKGHKHIIVQSPTGSGKTVIFSYIVKQLTIKQKRAIILTDREELLKETGGTLSYFGLKPYLITAGQIAPPPKFNNVYVAMSQTLKRRIKQEKFRKDWDRFFDSFDLVIIDEAHKQEFNDFFVDGVSVFGSAYVLGFTATPKRSGKQRQLAEDYTTIVKGPTVRELIDLGNLVDDQYFGVQSVDLTSVNIDKKTGDYEETAIYSQFNRPELYDGCVDEWVKHAFDTITIVFCVNIQHCIETCKAFNDRGIKAMFVTSDVAKPKLPAQSDVAGMVRYEKQLKDYNNYISNYKLYSGSRDKVITDWKRGYFKVLINAGILTTGFNHKPIQTVIINRATISDNLWLQMIGRGSRPYDGKKYFNILDFGGHGSRLGYYKDVRELSLIHESGGGIGVAPVKECGVQNRVNVKPDPETGYTIDKNGRIGCGAYLSTSKMICPFCGYEYDTEKERIKAELSLINYDIIRQPGMQIEMKNDRHSDLERIAEAKGYKKEWVYVNIALKEGYTGLMEYAKKRGYTQGWAWRMSKKYQQKIKV